MQGSGGCAAMSSIISGKVPVIGDMIGDSDIETIWLNRSFDSDFT